MAAPTETWMDLSTRRPHLSPESVERWRRELLQCVEGDFLHEPVEGLGAVAASELHLVRDVPVGLAPELRSVGVEIIHIPVQPHLCHTHVILTNENRSNTSRSRALILPYT